MTSDPQRAARAPAAKIPFFIRKTLGLLSRSTFFYDDVVRLRARRPIYLLTHPDDIRHVLGVNAENYVKTRHLTSDAGRARAGDGLLTSSGTRHHDQRRLLQPAFDRREVVAYANLIVDKTERLTAGWSADTEIDIAAAMTDLSQSLIIGALFGDDVPHNETAALARAIRARRRYTEYYYHSRLPWRESLPVRAVRDHRQALSILDRIIYDAIASRRGAGTTSDDLTAALLRLSDQDGGTMSDRQVRDEILTLTSTGYETIGDALSWVFYLLARHPHVEAKLLREIDQVLAGRAPRPEDAPKLKYAGMIVEETMRLYPPTWIYARVALNADTLPGGAAIPADATLYLCQYLMHRHPGYFRDPETFDPERFRDAAARRRLTYVYFPFGVGAHRCIGEHFANLQGVLVLAAIARRFRFELLSKDAVRPFAGITLRPARKLAARIEPRR